MGAKKNILVCPLDWGLGHATRMIPVINEIENQGGNVILAADNGPKEFLSQYYPKKEIIKLEGFQPYYPEGGSMAWAMLKSFPKMLSAARIAKKKLHKIIVDNHIDAIISDNRYELSSPNIPSVFVTHQLNIQTKGFQTLAKPGINLIINHFLSAFNEIWIPDFDDHYLSGILSNSNVTRKNLHYIGILSRFNQLHDKAQGKDIDVLLILSGPEPQRSILEQKVFNQTIKTRLKTFILQGKPQEEKHEIKDNVTTISHASDDEIISLMDRSNHIICRPGYSTIMDLFVLNKKAIFIPTPGQTEQEYLSEKLMKDSIALSVSQQSFDLVDVINKQHNYSGLLLPKKDGALKNRISFLLNNC